MTDNQTASSGISRRAMLKSALYSPLAMGLSSCVWLGGCSKRVRKKPNIILITVDTLRPDHLGCYGYHRNTSPNIDKFASEALLFEKCFSHASETRFSFASILTGFLPHETKIINYIPLPPGVDTLPEILQKQGYKTAAVISNYVLHKGKGFDQGFMIYDDTMEDRELIRSWPERIAERTTNRALELLRDWRLEQMFMWIHYQDPHGPYAPPAEYTELFHDPDQQPQQIKVNESLSGRGGIPSYQKLPDNSDFHYYVSQYDSEIRYQDDQFQRLINGLKELGLYDDSLILFSSDHGEGLGEHDYYFAHGEYLYNSLTHVPLIIRYGKDNSGRKSDYVQHIDILPTILKYIGVEGHSQLRGRDLLTPNTENREIFAEMHSTLVPDRRKFSLIAEGLKLIYTPRYRQYELFDLNVDPQEEFNLINVSRHLARANILKTSLQRLIQQDFLQLRDVVQPQKLTEDEKQKLRSLGYLK